MIFFHLLQAKCLKTARPLLRCAAVVVGCGEFLGGCGTGGFGRVYGFDGVEEERERGGGGLGREVLNVLHAIRSGRLLWIMELLKRIRNPCTWDRHLGNRRIQDGCF